MTEPCDHGRAHWADPVGFRIVCPDCDAEAPGDDVLAIRLPDTKPDERIPAPRLLRAFLTRRMAREP